MVVEYDGEELVLVAESSDSAIYHGLHYTSHSGFKPICTTFGKWQTCGVTVYPKPLLETIPFRLCKRCANWIERDRYQNVTTTTNFDWLPEHWSVELNERPDVEIAYTKV